MNPPRRVAIVGGGMLGVAIALELAATDAEVTIFEAGPTLGGLVAPWRVGDLEWDRYYHVTLGTDFHTRRLLRAIGVDDDLQLRSTSTGYWDGERVHPAETVREFLSLPGLSLVAKLRIGATIAINARRSAWRRIERIDARTWLRRWSGRAALERFWSAQLRAKFGDNHDDVAATLLWATFCRLDGARRGAQRREQMGYVRGGYARTVGALTEHVKRVGVVVRTSDTVEGIGRGDRPSSHSLLVGGANEGPFDDVIVTLAAPLAARLIDDLDPAAAQSLRSVRTMGVVCASVVLERPLAPHYLTYLAAPSPLTAVVDMSALVDADEFATRGLVYLPRYVDSDDSLFDVPDDELRERWLAALAEVYPELRDTPVLAFAVARARHVFAVPDVGYSAHVPPLSTAIPGVHVVSSAHLVHATLNVDETVALGTWAAQELLATGRIERDRLLARQ